MSPRVRVFAKVWAFGFALFFIFYFVVYGYRYTDGVGFVTKNAFYEATFWSDGQKITFDNASYVATNKKVQLFNIDSWCYDIVFHDKTTKQCVHKNSVTFDTFVTYKETVPYEEKTGISCAKVERQPHGPYMVKGMLYAKPIQAVFTAREVPFMQMDNKLFACTADYKQCHELTELKWDILCSVEEWIVFHKENGLFLMKLE